MQRGRRQEENMETSTSRCCVPDIVLNASCVKSLKETRYHYNHSVIWKLRWGNIKSLTQGSPGTRQTVILHRLNPREEVEGERKERIETHGSGPRQLPNWPSQAPMVYTWLILLKPTRGLNIPSSVTSEFLYTSKVLGFHCLWSIFIALFLSKSLRRRGASASTCI